jgi:hypothetical protein
MVGPMEIEIEFLSFSGIDLGADGLLYVGNETSMLSKSGSQFGVTYTVTTTKSILTVNPASGAGDVFSRNLFAVEGVQFPSNGAFPLYAVEEDIGSSNGRLSQVGVDGQPVVVCNGFGTIEDVAVDEIGRLFVSEDVGGNGRIIMLNNDNQYHLYLPAIQNIGISLKINKANVYMESGSVYNWESQKHSRTRLIQTEQRAMPERETD